LINNKEYEKDFVFALGITGILPGWSAEPENSI
jgi:hypothetical protein